MRRNVTLKRAGKRWNASNRLTGCPRLARSFPPLAAPPSVLLLRHRSSANKLNTNPLKWSVRHPNRYVFNRGKRTKAERQARPSRIRYRRTQHEKTLPWAGENETNGAGQLPLRCGNVLFEAGYHNCPNLTPKAGGDHVRDAMRAKGLITSCRMTVGVYSTRQAAFKSKLLAVVKLDAGNGRTHAKDRSDVPAGQTQSQS